MSILQDLIGDSLDGVFDGMAEKLATVAVATVAESARSAWEATTAPDRQRMLRCFRGLFYNLFKQSFDSTNEAAYEANFDACQNALKGDLIATVVIARNNEKRLINRALLSLVLGGTS